ncbi:response regulator transcription factor [Pseudomonas viridiflava]|uniref:response regulator transcription factor n=1 Tax=Pseudomonas viridiflava TaxID=33069 RepID=UPI000F05AECE|nr:response regulator transcription factor [Pseudomonas viridiflava]
MNTNSSVKVLVVDHQPSVVSELSEFLQNSGYECSASYSSKEALEQFRNDPAVGIVLCDLHMPKSDGVELVEALKLVAGKKRVFETIALTANDDKQEVIKALRAGVADYFQKPVNLNELLEGVQRQEAVLHERQKSFRQLGELNEKLRFLAASIDDLYEDLDRVRPSPAAPSAEQGAEEEVDLSVLFAPLSPRQQDVARLVAKGHTNYQIGCKLGITENTVKLYVSQVLRLTHMHNRTQLALAMSPSGANRVRDAAH